MHADFKRKITGNEAIDQLSALVKVMQQRVHIVKEKWKTRESNNKYLYCPQSARLNIFLRKEWIARLVSGAFPRVRKLNGQRKNKWGREKRRGGK